MMQQKHAPHRGGYGLAKGRADERRRPHHGGFQIGFGTVQRDAHGRFSVAEARWRRRDDANLFRVERRQRRSYRECSAPSAVAHRIEPSLHR